MSEWFDDESFGADFFPFMFPRERIEAAEEQVTKGLVLCDVAGRHVLALCCGPGRHAIALARRGYEVIGVDIIPFLLDKARKRACQEDTVVEWIQGSMLDMLDMLDFVRPNAFDLVLSMFTSFGHFEDKSDDVKALRNIHENLKPDGAVLIDVMGKKRLAKVLQPTTSDVLPDGTQQFQHHEILDDWSRIRNEWFLIRDGAAKSHEFHHTLYSGQELKDRLYQVGFENVKLYGDLDGNEYGSDAKRLVAVAR